MLAGAESYNFTTLSPKLTITGTEENPQITGTVEIAQKCAQKILEQAVVSVDLKRAEPLVWRECQETVNLSELDELSLIAVQQKIAASIATTLIRPLIVTMGEDAQWFFRDLSADAVQSIIDAAATVAQ